MKRNWVVVVAVAVALVVAVTLFVRQGRGPRDPGAGVTLAERLYQNDSLGVRLRIPETPGWTLQGSPGVGADGRVVTASHSDGTATVRLLSLPATDETTVDGVFEARQRQIASTFGLAKMDQLVAEVLQDERRDIAGRTYRQWQALSNPIEAPGEPPARVVFMWLVTATPRASFECIGLVRFPATPDADAQARADAHLRDVAFILQSFELR
jgi:hypothetical protein